MKKRLIEMKDGYQFKAIVKYVTVDGYLEGPFVVSDELVSPHELKNVFDGWNEPEQLKELVNGQEIIVEVRKTYGYVGPLNPNEGFQNCEVKTHLVYIR